MKAINYFLIVEKVKQETKKIAGLLITEQTDVDNSFDKGVVVSVGNLVQGLNEKDVIYYKTSAGHGITIKDKLYKVILSKDVVLVE
jgi:co-chaperonin GroES (HSP10)|tara:strand:+ start:1215 stop:1472 length:258 start_codon:yes stop_codon:yes gene_type:complete